MMTDQTIMFLALPFLAALVSPIAVRLAGHRAAWLLALFPAAIFLHLATFAETVSQGDKFTGGIQWIPSLGIRLNWYVDGLSLVFGLLITGIGALIVLYSGGYLKGHPQLGRFLAFIFLFMGSMLGLVMADNFYALLVLWEMTSITSFLLIGFDHNRTASRRAALQALVVTGGGGLSLIAAMIIIHGVSGISEFSLLLASDPGLRGSSFYVAIFVLVLGGAFTKSAQFPLHFWLPNAMEAPTPVSAYLHSATMVKAGVYLLMRLNPVLGETLLWETVLPLFGSVTLVIGGLLAVRQTDLKLMLAYTTVASLGLLVMLTGFGSEKAIEAAVYYLVAHSLFKGGLFMVAGAIDHEAGSRDIRKLGGLRRDMPLTFVAAALASLSMSGIPPLFGFIAKEEIYYALAKPDVWSIAILVCAVAGNSMMVAIAAAIAIKPFLGEMPKGMHAHEAPPLLLTGPAMLAVLSLATGIFAFVANRYLISPMASAVFGEAVDARAVVALHIGMPLALSVLTLAFGYGLFRNIERARLAIALLLHRIGWGPDRSFDQFIAGIVNFATAATRMSQNGRLDSYMTTVFVSLALALFAAIFAAGEWPSMPEMPSMRFYEWGILAIALTGLAAVLWANNRLTAIVCLGIQGFAVAVIFMLFGAPDLSFTQFMVETLSVVILALVMTRLTLHKSDHRAVSQRLKDGFIAIAVGAAIAMMLLAVVQTPFDASLSDFFAQYSRTIAHGRNIVNVIIVDFRGLDTLGEIAVVMVTGLAILSLIRVRQRRPYVEAAPEVGADAPASEPARQGEPA